MKRSQQLGKTDFSGGDERTAMALRGEETFTCTPLGREIAVQLCPKWCFKKGFKRCYVKLVETCS